MKRLMIWLAALAVVLGLSLVPVSANSAPDSFAHSNDSNVVLRINVTRDPGTIGITVNFITMSCVGDAWAAGWDHPSVDGHFMHLHKNVSTSFDLVWDRNDANSNVDADGFCFRKIDVDRHFETHSLLLEWGFTEQVNLQPDKNDEIDIRVVNGDG